MKVEQVATLANNITNELLGKSDIVAEDLSNVVDFGEEILDFSNGNLDNYVKTLIDQIGKIVFVDRKYTGRVPSVLMDGWEYGSICEKITMNSLPEAKENDTWKLENGHSYDPFVFNGPDVSAKFFNSIRGRYVFCSSAGYGIISEWNAVECILLNDSDSNRKFSDSKVR